MKKGGIMARVKKLFIHLKGRIEKRREDKIEREKREKKRRKDKEK
jgi:hypothetical protein